MKLKPGLAAGLAGALAGAGITGAALPARANFENEVTVHGTAVTGEVVASTRLSISVERAAPELTVNITADPAQEVTAGDRVQLTYRIVNSGNVTLDNLRLQVEQEGHGAAPVLVRVENDDVSPVEAAEADGAAEQAIAEAEEEGVTPAGIEMPGPLAPGEAAIFTAEYVVVQDDMEDHGGGDGVLEARALATATRNGAETSAEGSLRIALEDLRATLEIAKSADRTENVAVGEVITYTYAVTNTGNVAIHSISLTENHNGSGPPPRPSGEQLLVDNGVPGDSTDREPDGIWDVLGPQDVVSFTATYTVTQTDVDMLQ